jgi:hypothetical protein
MASARSGFKNPILTIMVSGKDKNDKKENANHSYWFIVAAIDINSAG